jgi:hypothetical protein
MFTFCSLAPPESRSGSATRVCTPRRGAFRLMAVAIAPQNGGVENVGAQPKPTGWMSLWTGALQGRGQTSDHDGVSLHGLPAHDGQRFLSQCALPGHSLCNHGWRSRDRWSTRANAPFLLPALFPLAGWRAHESSLVRGAKMATTTSTDAQPVRSCTRSYRKGTTCVRSDLPSRSSTRGPPWTPSGPLCPIRFGAIRPPPYSSGRRS